MWVKSGVGNDFFPRVGSSGVDLVLELRGVAVGGFWDPKFDQFCSKFRNKPNLGLNHFKLALIELNQR